MEKVPPIAEALAALAEFEAMPGDGFDGKAVEYASKELVKAGLAPVSSIADIWDSLMNSPGTASEPVLAAMRKAISESKDSSSVPLPSGYSWKEAESAIMESMEASKLFTKTGRRPKRWQKGVSLFADERLSVLALADFGPEAMANPLAYALDKANYPSYSSVVHHRRARGVKLTLAAVKTSSGNVISQSAGDLGGVSLHRLHPLWNRYHPLIWWALQKGVLQKWILEYALRRN